jgi:hypothetical protein
MSLNVTVTILRGDGGIGGLQLQFLNGGLAAVCPIPSYPEVKSGIFLLQVAAAMAETQGRISKFSVDQLASLTRSIANLAARPAQRETGRMDGESVLIYQDEDGDFVCGTENFPPVFVPHHPQPGQPSMAISSFAQPVQAGIHRPRSRIQT